DGDDVVNIVEAVPVDVVLAAEAAQAARHEVQVVGIDDSTVVDVGVGGGGRRGRERAHDSEHRHHAGGKQGYAVHGSGGDLGCQADLSSGDFALDGPPAREHAGNARRGGLRAPGGSI